MAPLPPRTEPAPWTASTLYALANGQDETSSCKQCFLCGGPATNMPMGDYQSSLRLKPGQRLQPGCVNSDLICRGCHASLRESCTVDMPPLKGSDGNKRVEQMAPIRRFSWIITLNGAVACNSTADRHVLRQACIQPPSPPYAIVIADDGYHVMHKAKAVQRDSKKALVYYDDQNIEYDPKELADLIKLAGMVAIACNAVPPESYADACESRYVGGKKMFKSWLDKSKLPLTGLAAFLCPPLDECRDMYPMEPRKELAKA